VTAAGTHCCGLPAPKKTMPNMCGEGHTRVNRQPPRGGGFGPRPRITWCCQPSTPTLALPRPARRPPIPLTAPPGCHRPLDRYQLRSKPPAVLTSSSSLPQLVIGRPTTLTPLAACCCLFGDPSVPERTWID
jgi:hypothetical protein